MQTNSSAGGVRAEMFLVGGAAISFAYNTRRSTRDVDAVFEPKETVRDAAAMVADRRGIPRDWLNDAVKGYLPGVDQDRRRAIDRPGLSVDVASPRYLLAMKLLAAREGDIEDIRTLYQVCEFSTAEEGLDLLEASYPRHLICALAGRRDGVRTSGTWPRAKALYRYPGGVDEWPDDPKSLSRSRCARACDVAGRSTWSSTEAGRIAPRSCSRLLGAVRRCSGSHPEPANKPGRTSPPRPPGQAASRRRSGRAAGPLARRVERVLRDQQLAEDWIYRYLAAAHARASTETAALAHIAPADAGLTWPNLALPEPSARELRAWAGANGPSMPDRGGLRPEILAAWRDASTP